MIGWLRRVFARRAPDPELEAARTRHAEHSPTVDATAARAHDVAGTVIRDIREQRRPRPLRSSFAFDEADQRLFPRR